MWLLVNAQDGLNHSVALGRTGTGSLSHVQERCIDALTRSGRAGRTRSGRRTDLARLGQS